MDRRIVRTIEFDEVEFGGEQVSQLKISEPMAGLMLRLSDLETKNQHAKRERDIRDPFPVIFEALTGFDAAILHLLPLRVGQEITEAIGEAMGVDEGKE